MEKLILKMQIKEQTDDGNIALIEGIANKANVVDKGNDITISETFKNTVEKRPAVPLLKLHDWNRCIGVNNLSLGADGSLKTLLQINLDTQDGKEQYSLAKQFQEANIPLGLSIGYRTLKEKTNEDGNNVLLDVEVREVSLTPFPMNEQSTTTVVKQDTGSDLYKIRENKIKKLLLLGD